MQISAKTTQPISFFFSPKETQLLFMQITKMISFQYYLSVKVLSILIKINLMFHESFTC